MHMRTVCRCLSKIRTCTIRLPFSRRRVCVVSPFAEASYHLILILVLNASINQVGMPSMIDTTVGWASGRASGLKKLSDEVLPT